MTFEQLKEKALGLPLEPGVYLMRDKTDRVIYVGKAKRLKNRVSQYFQDTASHSPKTRLMVSKVDRFEVIVAASEFEALVLECSLIKRHQPKYNILLKDDKGYPYIRLSVMDPYPRMEVVSRVDNDGAAYFGPFGSRGITQNILQTLQLTLKLPSCKKNFPRDRGKDRPCLHYHMNQCSGWCQENTTREDYLQRIGQVRELLSGNYKKVAQQIRQQMLRAAENLEFELAAGLRDRLNAVEALGQKQLVTAGSLADTDVIGYGQAGARACFTVLHYSGGQLLDKDYEVFSLPEDPEAAVSSLLKQYYLVRGMAPKVVLLPFPMEDGELFSQLLEQNTGKKTRLRVPQRGEFAHMVELANKNAGQEAERVSTKEEKLSAAVTQLGALLSMEPPGRIEAFDISNIAGTDIVAAMVVFEEGKPRRSDYKRFRLEGLENQDDYASMDQVLRRRFHHMLQGDKGFEKKPDLLLIDGGEEHAAVAERALEDLGLSVRVFGMVKDDRHRTRALVTPEGQLIHIDGRQAVFALVGTIQEETHRFAITYHRQLRSKRLHQSELDRIPGIGEKRKQELLKSFRSVSAVAAATLPELERLLPKNAAYNVYQYFHKEKDPI